MNVAQNSQKFWIRVRRSLTEVLGTGIEGLQNSQKFRVLRRGRTKLTKVQGTHNNVVAVRRVLWDVRIEL